MSDEARSRLPSLSRNQDHVERANVLIQEDGRITVSEVAEMLDIRQIEICSLQQKKTAVQQCSLAPLQFSLPMVRPQRSRRFETSCWWFCRIHLTVPSSHHATFKPLVHLKRHYVVAGLAYMDSETI